VFIMVINRNDTHPSDKSIEKYTFGLVFTLGLGVCHISCWVFMINLKVFKVKSSTGKDKNLNNHIAFLHPRF